MDTHWGRPPIAPLLPLSRRGLSKQVLRPSGGTCVDCMEKKDAERWAVEWFTRQIQDCLDNGDVDVASDYGRVWSANQYTVASLQGKRCVLSWDGRDICMPYWDVRRRLDNGFY